MVSSPFANEMLGYCSALAPSGICFPFCVAFFNSSVGKAGLDVVRLVLSQLPYRESQTGPKPTSKQIHVLRFL